MLVSILGWLARGVYSKDVLCKPFVVLSIHLIQDKPQDVKPREEGLLQVKLRVEGGIKGCD